MYRRALLSISLDRRRSSSLQEQLSQALRERIQSGLLEAGGSLPSSRELSSQLCVSRNTVIAAYDRLLGEGYLETSPRSGIFVNRDFIPKSSSNKGIRRSGQRPSPSLKGTDFQCREPLPFRPSQPDVRLFPMATWNRNRNRAIRKLGAGLLHYQSRFALGIPSLRLALAEYLNASRGVRCDWTQIAITGGSQQALYLLGQLLLKPNDKVWIEEPGYPGARNAFQRAGAEVQPMLVDEHGVVPPIHIGVGKLIYVTPSRQFPTGASLPVARRMAMIEAAQSAKAWLIEDDYDSEFRYAGPPLPSLQSLDLHGRVIYIGSMSKVLFPSLRIGYIVLPQELVEPFEALRLIVDDHGPLIDQAALAEFISTGAFYTHIRRCRKTYSGRLQAFLNAADRYKLPLSFPHIDGGMNQMGYFNHSRANADVASRSLALQGIDVPALSRFAMEKIRPGLVFGFTPFDQKTIESMVAKVARVLNGM